MILSEYVTIRYSPYIKKVYENKGYIFDKQTKTTTVCVDDLPETSNAKIKLQCDYCGKIYETIYANYVRGLRNGNEKCACFDCRHKKYVEVCLEKYGVENTMKVDSVKEKLVETCVEKYGVRNTAIVPEIREKQRKTCLERYGFESPLSSKEIRNKINQTNLQKYGTINAMQNSDVVAKVRKSLEDSGKCCSSKAQKHIHDLIGGIMNKQFYVYNVDIFIEPNIYVEYDGGGHKLNVQLGHITEKDFVRKQAIRYRKLKSCGLKEIRLINVSDKLPNDDVLLSAIKSAIFFLTNFDDNWIEINLDNGNVKTKNRD